MYMLGAKTEIAKNRQQRVVAKTAPKRNLKNVIMFHSYLEYILELWNIHYIQYTIEGVRRW